MPCEGESPVDEIVQNKNQFNKSLTIHIHKQMLCSFHSANQQMRSPGARLKPKYFAISICFCDGKYEAFEMREEGSPGWCCWVTSNVFASVMIGPTSR